MHWDGSRELGHKRSCGDQTASSYFAGKASESLVDNVHQEQPWLAGVEGDQVRHLIEVDVPTLRVQAGAGTGKTFGLRRRVLRLLHPRGLAVDPARVLVCAFNRVIARELEADIAAELEPHGLSTPTVKTIHSLCATLIGQSPRYLLPHEIKVMIYDVRTMYPNLDATYGKRQSRAMRALREHESRVKDHPGLATAVRQWLADHGAALLGDVPRAVEEAIAGGTLPEPRYDHVLVDEFQDLTETEARVVVGLRAAQSSLVALGDRKQSIYAFRGNADRGLNALPDLVGGAVADHTMNECRRCPKELVDLANALMELEGEPLVDVRGPGGQIHNLYFRTPKSEAERIALEALRVFEARPEERHLVLATRRQWGYAVKQEILNLNPEAPVRTVFAEDVLESWPAREAFGFLSILATPGDAVSLRDWVAYQEDEDGRDFLAPARNAPAYLDLKAHGGVLTMERALQLGERPEAHLSGKGKTNIRQRLIRLRELVAALPETDEPASLVEHILAPQAWVDYPGPRAEHASEDINRLRDEAHRLLAEEPELTLGDLVRQLRFRIATREPLGESPAGSGIRIVTLWGAKGLTADHVYIVGLFDEALPGRHDPESTGLTPSEFLDEQRRLLYVSLTRARSTLVLARPLKVRRGDIAALGLQRTNRVNRYWQHLQVCRFLTDVSHEVLPAAVAGEVWRGVNL